MVTEFNSIQKYYQQKNIPGIPRDEEHLRNKLSIIYIKHHTNILGLLKVQELDPKL